MSIPPRESARRNDDVVASRSGHYYESGTVQIRPIVDIITDWPVKFMMSRLTRFDVRENDPSQLDLDLNLSPLPRAYSYSPSSAETAKLGFEFIRRAKSLRLYNNRPSFEGRGKKFSTFFSCFSRDPSSSRIITTELSAPRFGGQWLYKYRGPGAVHARGQTRVSQGGPC